MSKNLPHWVDLVQKGKNPGYALVISGPPGSGKSVLSKNLADSAELPLVQIKGVQLARPEMLHELPPCILLLNEAKDLSQVKELLSRPPAKVKGIIVETSLDLYFPPEDCRFLAVRLKSTEDESRG